MKYHTAFASLLILLILGVAATVAAQGFKVTDAKVSVPAAMLDYRGRCPVDVAITGAIQTSGPGLVKYQFVHSSGASGPVQQMISYGARWHDVRESPVRTFKADAPPWVDTVTLRIHSNPGGLFDSPPVKYVGACSSVTAVQQPATQSAYFGPAQANFRVTINGFTCVTPTADTSVLGDGAGDEVFMFTKTFNVEVRPNGGQNTTSDFTLSLPYGDIGNGQQYGQRIRAGSSRYLGSNGGIVAGDSYPISPEKHSTDPQRQTLPQLVWQGTIARFKNGVVIVPMIWESDGQARYQGDYQRLELSNTPFTFSQLIKEPRTYDLNGVGFAIRADFDRIAPLDRAVYNVPIADAPIGLREAGGFRFRAQALFLTYDEAVRMAEFHRTTGKAFPITYTSDAGATGGSYTIWVQLEQLP